MALNVEETRVLTIDGNTIAVETLDAQTKELVNIYDHWKVEAAETRSKLMQIQTAMQGLAAQIARSAMGEGEEGVADEVTEPGEVGDNPDGE